MSDSPANKPKTPGVFSALAGLLGTLSGEVKTRLELLSTEMQQEFQFAIQVVIALVLVLFFFGMGAIMTTILVLAYFWDDFQTRMIATGCVAGFYLLAALFIMYVTVLRAKARPKPFSSTMDVLQKDADTLRRK